MDAGYRVAAGEELRGGCPACGDDAWVDLRREDVVLALSENESFAMGQTARGWAAQSASVLVLGSAGVFLGVMLAQLFLGTGAFLPAGLTTVATVLAAVAIIRRLYELGRPPHLRTLPMRWRYALPGPKPPRLDAVSVSLSGEPLVAPLSGRPCLAYDIGVRTDDDGKAPLGTWLLVEQVTASLAAAGVTIPAGKAWLELRERARHRAQEPAGEERLQRFLRERGFNPHDLVVFETIVEPHATVKACTRDGRIVVEDEPLLELPAARV